MVVGIFSGSLWLNTFGPKAKIISFARSHARTGMHSYLASQTSDSCLVCLLLSAMKYASGYNGGHCLVLAAFCAFYFCIGLVHVGSFFLSVRPGAFDGRRTDRIFFGFLGTFCWWCALIISPVFAALFLTL